MSSSFCNIFKIEKLNGKPKSSSENISNTAHNAVIKLYLSYAYTNTKAKYTVKTPIINPNRVSLNSLLDKLTKSITLQALTVSYNENGDEVYFYCGIYPLSQLILCEVTPSKSLWVKLRKTIDYTQRMKLDLLEEEEIKNVSLNEAKKTNHHINTKSRRNNERVIRDIVSKVYLWKKLSQGIINTKGILVHLTLEEAAEVTEIKKKSLIEYQQQLQLGRLLGFDFNKHRNEKVNVLRGYVKNQLKLFELSSLKNLKSRKKFEEEIEAEKLSAVEKKDEELSQ